MERIVPIEYNGAVCEVKSMNNKLLATGQLKLLDDDLLEILDEGENMPVLRLDGTVKLIIYHTTLPKKVMVGKVYISNHGLLRLTNLKSSAEYESRRFFRLAIDHSATLLPASKASKNEYPIRVKDISLCGILFECDRLLSVGDKMRVRMTMERNREEIVDVIVRRIIPQTGGVMRYGCEMVDLSSHVEQRLGAFIFRQQQEQIRRSRGKHMT